MNEHTGSAARRYTLLLCAAGVLALAGCEQHPYPTPSYDAPPPPPPATDTATPPANAAPPTAASAGTDVPMPAAPTAAPQSPPSEAYSPDGTAPGATMAPIPNPPVQMDDTQTWADRHENFRPGAHHGHMGHGRHHRHAAPANPAIHALAPPPAHAAKSAHKRIAKPVLKKPAPPVAKADPKAARTRSLDALQLAMGDALARGAALSQPVGAPGGQVVLTLSPGFTDAVRKAAVENGLSDANAPITATAGLSADGYTSQSPLTQSQPLATGQSTDFRWQLTARTPSREPIKANVCVNVASGPELICGGTVQASETSSGISGRAIGIGLLVLIAGVVIGWLMRGRGNGGAKPATASATASSGTKPRTPGW